MSLEKRAKMDRSKYPETMAKTVVSKTDETSVHKAQKTPNKIIQTKQHVGTLW